MCNQRQDYYYSDKTNTKLKVNIKINFCKIFSLVTSTARSDHYPLGQPKGQAIDQSETAKSNHR